VSNEETPPPAPAEGGTTDPPTPPPPQETPTESADEPLGEGGIRALEAERERRRAATEKNKALAARIAELEQQSMSDNERAIADARTEGEKAAEERWRERAGKLAVQAAAAGKFADPADVVRYLDDGVPFDADGEVDSKALEARLSELLEAKPYLGVTPATPPPPAGMAPGVRGGSAAITPESVKQMTPAQVAAAYERGDLNSILTST
jgi:DNA-binding transcriptional MerR regulator